MILQKMQDGSEDMLKDEEEKRRCFACGEKVEKLPPWTKGIGRCKVRVIVAVNVLDINVRLEEFQCSQ